MAVLQPERFLRHSRQGPRRRPGYTIMGYCRAHSGWPVESGAQGHHAVLSAYFGLRLQYLLFSFAMTGRINSPRSSTRYIILSESGTLQSLALQKSHQTKLRQSFYVSPFVPMTCHYEFRLQPLTRLGLSSGKKMMTVFFWPPRFLGIASSACSFDQNGIEISLMTLKVMAGIHIEAVPLAKKAPYFPQIRKGYGKKRLYNGGHCKNIVVKCPLLFVRFLPFWTVPQEK